MDEFIVTLGFEDGTYHRQTRLTAEGVCLQLKRLFDADEKIVVVVVRPQEQAAAPKKVRHV